MSKKEVAFPATINTLRQSDIPLPTSMVIQGLGWLLGRVLTVIDSSIPEGQQNKALKDVIRTSFADEERQILEFADNYTRKNEHLT